jgi:hypothetical protein
MTEEQIAAIPRQRFRNRHIGIETEKTMKMICTAVESINVNPFRFRVLPDVADNRPTNFSHEVVFPIFRSPHSVNPHPDVCHAVCLSGLKPSRTSSSEISGLKAGVTDQLSVIL